MHDLSIAHPHFLKNTRHIHLNRIYEKKKSFLDNKSFLGERKDF